MPSRTARCPKCETALTLPAAKPGLIKGACPKCGAKFSFTMPAPSPIAAGEPKALPTPKGAKPSAPKKSLAPLFLIGGALAVCGILGLCLVGGIAFWLLGRGPRIAEGPLANAAAENKAPIAPKDNGDVGPGKKEPKEEPEAAIDPEPRLAVRYGPNMRFGITVLKDAAGNAVNKKLTYDAIGGTNHAMVRIDGLDLEFGGPGGQWRDRDVRAGNSSRSVWVAQGIEIAQDPGDRSEQTGDSNRSRSPQTPARYLLDTLRDRQQGPARAQSRYAHHGGHTDRRQ